jgi:hypothetical protein
MGSVVVFIEASWDAGHGRLRAVSIDSERRMAVVYPAFCGNLVEVEALSLLGWELNDKRPKARLAHLHRFFQRAAFRVAECSTPW